MERLDGVERDDEPFRIALEPHQDFEAVVLDVLLLEVILQDDGHIVGIFRLEADR